MTAGTYRAASGLGGKRPWRVIWQPADTPSNHRELVDTRGSIVRFASWQSAKARADALNAAGIGEPEKHPGYQYRMPSC